METVGNSTHTVLTNTVADVCSSICSETSARGLEVESVALDLGQVGASQISRATDELWELGHNFAEDNLGKFARCDSGVSGFVDGESLLPSLSELAGNAAGELSVLGGVFLAVFREKSVPLSLEGSTALAKLGVEIVGLLGDLESLVGIEAKLVLQVDDVVSLESCKTVSFGLRVNQQRKDIRAPCTPWVPCCLDP